MQQQFANFLTHTHSVWNAVVTFIETYPPVVLIVFGLSVLANLVQIGTYLRDRKRIAKETVERERMARLVETYEDVLKVARERVQDQEAAHALAEEVREKKGLARSLRERIETIEQVAQRNLVKQTLQHHLDALRKSYEEVSRLKRQYSDIKIDMPEHQIAAIEQEMRSTLAGPAFLPQPFVHRAGLLFLLLFLARWPVAGFLMPLLLKPLLVAFFEAVRLLDIKRLSIAVVRYSSAVIFLSALAVWQSFYSAISTVGKAFAEPVWLVARMVYDWCTWPVVLISAYFTWRAIRDEMMEKVSSLRIPEPPPSEPFEQSASREDSQQPYA